jgi:hypothetical protein
VVEEIKALIEKKAATLVVEKRSNRPLKNLS